MTTAPSCYLFACARLRPLRPMTFRARVPCMHSDLVTRVERAANSHPDRPGVFARTLDLLTVDKPPVADESTVESQTLCHVDDVVQSADAECGVAPLGLYAGRSIEGYVRPHAVTAAPPCYLSARDCWAAVLPFACGHSLPASRTVLRPLRPMTVRARVPLHA